MKTIALGSFLAIAAALVWAGLPRLAGHALTAPGDPDVLEVQQAAAGPGLARHPLLLHVHGRNAGGLPRITNTAPRGNNPAQVRADLGLHPDGAGPDMPVLHASGHPSNDTS